MMVSQAPAARSRPRRPRDPGTPGLYIYIYICITMNI